MKISKLFIVLALSFSFAGNAFADRTNYKWIKDIRYEEVRHFSNSLSAFKQDGKWGFMNAQAKVVIAPQYEECRDFTNSYAAVKLNGLWGYINYSGTMVIPPHFQEALDFNEDRLAVVKKDGKYGVINTKGTSPAGIIFDEVGQYSNGFALAKAAGVQYYLDNMGKSHNLSEGFQVRDFSEGMAPLKNLATGKWGFVDSRGKLAIDVRYDTVYNFSNGVALVKHKGEYQYITKTGGKKKIESATGQPLSFVNGFAKIKTSRGIGFIGKDFKLLPIYGKTATDFNEAGLAALETEDNELCYIDKAGRIKFKVKYDRIGNFSNGLAWVSKNDKYGYINTKGELVIDTIFTSATDFRDSLAYVSTKDRFGCIRYNPGYSMPKVRFADITLKDANGNGKVEAEEKFDIEVVVANPSREDLYDVKVRLANQVDQEQWFAYDSMIVTIPCIKAYREEKVSFKGVSDLSIMSSDVSVRFWGTTSSTLSQNEHTWSFETVGIRASKPIITRYWIYNDEHTPIRGGQVNLLMTVKNEGKDPAKDVSVDIQMPEGAWTHSPVLNISSLQPGESRDVQTVFHIEEGIDPDQIIVAKISDITQQHNKVEYLSYTIGKTNAEVRLDGSAVFSTVQTTPPAGQMPSVQIASLPNEGIGKDAFVSDLYIGMEKVATPDNNKYALIFGNENYNQSGSVVLQQNVEFAQADAEAFYQYAINYLGVPSNHIRMRSNGSTRYQMTQELNFIEEWLKGKGGNGELYVFYAGHGQPDDESGATYLMPVDIPLSDVSSGIKLDDFYGKIASMPARKKFVFLDACYSGQGRAGRLSLNLVEPTIRGNMIVFTATNSLQKSMPYREKRHGLFTYYLLNTIKAMNGKLSVKELFESTKEDVSHSSVNINESHQTPELIPGEGIEAGWENWNL